MADGSAGGSDSAQLLEVSKASIGILSQHTCGSLFLKVIPALIQKSYSFSGNRTIDRNYLD